MHARKPIAMRMRNPVNMTRYPDMPSKVDRHQPLNNGMILSAPYPNGVMMNVAAPIVSIG